MKETQLLVQQKYFSYAAGVFAFIAIAISYNLIYSLKKLLKFIEINKKLFYMYITEEETSLYCCLKQFVNSSSVDYSVFKTIYFHFPLFLHSLYTIYT